MSDDTKTSGLVRASRIYLIVVGSLLLVRACVVTNVDAGTIGVRYNNAMGLHEQDLLPGFHLEIIGLQRIWRLPSRYLLLNYTGERAISIRTKDNNTLGVDVSIPYRIQRGKAWRVMDAGNHLRDGEGRFRFQRFAEETATSVLRETLAQLRSEDFYRTDRRLEVARGTLKALNKKLAEYHLEAAEILVRATYFRREYETQLAQIQFNEQQKLLDGAKQRVAERQQKLDNYQLQTDAMVSAKEQSWAERIAQLDRAYQVGFVEEGEDRSPGAVRGALGKLSEEDRAALFARASEVFEIGPERVTEAHLVGIKNVEAETVEYTGRVRAEAEAISARLSAEGQAQVAKLEGAYESRVNQLLGSPAGRAYVAYQVAQHVQFAPELTFQSDDGIPAVLRLGDFARQLMGR